MLWKGELATHGPHKYVTGHGGFSQGAPVTWSPCGPLSQMLPASTSWQEVPRNQSMASILARPASALPFPEMEAGLTARKIRLSDLPCAEWSGLADGAPGWAYCGLGVGGEIYALLHRWRDVCVVSHVWRVQASRGWHRPAEAVGLCPGAAPPPFFSLISTRRGSPISRKKVLFFSYSSSSITLTDIVLLKQRRIEIDEQGEEEREEKEHREEESQVNVLHFQTNGNWENSVLWLCSSRRGMG